MHRILKSWVKPKYEEVKRLFLPIIDGMIWSCVNGRNEDASATETDMSMLTLTYHKLKYWQKMWLEGTMGKWPEAQRVA